MNPMMQLLSLGVICFQFINRSGTLTDIGMWDSQNTQLDDIGGHDFHADQRSWEEVLGDRIEEICDRKRSSVESRENAYSAYIRFLLANYARDEIDGRTTELAEAFLKSIKGGRSEKEAALAVRGMFASDLSTK